MNRQQQQGKVIFLPIIKLVPNDYLYQFDWSLFDLELELKPDPEREPGPEWEPSPEQAYLGWCWVFIGPFRPTMKTNCSLRLSYPPPPSGLNSLDSCAWKLCRAVFNCYTLRPIFILSGIRFQLSILTKYKFAVMSALHLGFNRLVGWL